MQKNSGILFKVSTLIYNCPIKYLKNLSTKIMIEKFYNTRSSFFLIFFSFFSVKSLFRRMVCRILITSVHSLVSIIPLSSGYRENSRPMNEAPQNRRRLLMHCQQWISLSPEEISSYCNEFELCWLRLFRMQMPSRLYVDCNLFLITFIIVWHTALFYIVYVFI